MTQIWILWESSGSYDGYHKSIHKIYSDELVANSERDRLNQGLKDEMKRLNKIIETVECTCETLVDDEECEYHEAEWSRWNLEEQWDYVVEGFEVEGEYV